MEHRERKVLETNNTVLAHTMLNKERVGHVKQMQDFGDPGAIHHTFTKHQHKYLKFLVYFPNPLNFSST